MSGDGGGGGYQQQDNSLQLEMMREQAARDAQAAADAKAKQDEVDFQTKLGNAVTGAKTTGDNYLTSRGLAPADFSSVEDSIINDAKLKVPDLDANPGSFFTTDTFASGMDNYQNLQRANLNSKVNSTFAPGFDTSLIPNSSSDSLINSILGEQQGTAQQQLDFNKKRGLLNDSGYNEAEAELGRQGSAGRSTLSDIANSILGVDRGNLNTIKGNAGTTASNYTLGQPAPDIGAYYKQAQDKATSDLGGLEGSIRSALGSTNLFDVPTAIQKGGIAQGPMNLTTADQANGVPFSTKKTVANRGLGSTNVF